MVGQAVRFFCYTAIVGGGRLVSAKRLVGDIGFYRRNELVMAMTVPRMVFSKAEARSERVALRHKCDGHYHDISWQEMTANCGAFGQALVALDLQPGERVAIMAPNGPGWVFADLGIMAAGGVTVPVYQTESVANLLKILEDSGSRFLFLHSPFSDRSLVEKLDLLPALEKVILFHGQRDDPRFLRLSDFLEESSEAHRTVLEQRLAAGNAADTATLVYTSGTTGRHKGVKLTHANILASIEVATEVFEVGPQDTCLSFLPLSHVLERVDGYYLMLHQGAVIAYAESADTLPVNLTEVRPTVMVGVPRLYEKMHERVMEQVQASSGFKKQLFAASLEIGQAYTAAVMSGVGPSVLLRIASRFVRPLAFAMLHRKLGGRLRYSISGGAPLARDVAEFFFAVNLPVYEGYGLTETTSGVAVNAPAAFRFGTVGKLLPGTKVRIAEDGEILLSGPTIAAGYWNLAEQEAEAFQGDWLHTGDIGILDQEGFLTITDRKKDLIVTAGGRNIPPQVLECRLKSDRYLSNAILFGDGKPFLTALLVPNFETLAQYARRHQVDYLNRCDLVTHPRILQLIRRHVERLQHDLPGYGQIKRFTLLSRDFSSELGEMTPTLKLKRRVVARNFSSVIDNMYLERDHGVHDSGFCMVDDPGKS